MQMHQVHIVPLKAVLLALSLDPLVQSLHLFGLTSLDKPQVHLLLFALFLLETLFFFGFGEL